MPTDVKREGESLLEAFRYGYRIVRSNDVIKQDRELVAAESRRGVGWPKIGRDALGDARQQLVAE